MVCALEPTRGDFHADDLRPPDGLRTALGRLIVGGENPQFVRGEISASWARSIESGLVPGRLEVPFHPTDDADDLLVRVAADLLAQLSDDLAGAGVAVLLTNGRGQVTYRAADEALIERLDAVRLAPGYVYGEDVVGTNGIGVAIAQRSPASVDGSEHFADALTGFSCAAAPITDPSTGRILGAIDLTCVASEASPLMLLLAKRVAYEIEQCLLDAAAVNERLVLQRFLQERRAGKGPLVVLTDSTMLANSAAARLLGPGDEEALRAFARHLLPGGSPQAVTMTLRGRTVTVRAEPVRPETRGAAVMLRLSPIDANTGAAVRSARHMTFGWDSLTPTERSVAELVAHGLTNREAGERLFLSHHTVGFHLRSIFRKLDVSSRVGLARLVVERDADVGIASGESA
jgi:transcriptional regulator of acetoin/glycerol metabolism/DNA-binding CsgD family transcriptional regulator